MQLRNTIVQNLTSEPDARALEFKHHWFSRGQVKCFVDTLNALLDAAGLGAETPVGVIARNRPSVGAAIVGVVMTGRCVVPITPFQNPQRLLDDIHELRTPVVIAAAQDWAIEGLREAVATTGAIGIVVADDEQLTAALVDGATVPGPGPFHPVLSGIVINMTTSGTTGKPKRVPIAYSTFEINAINWTKMDALKDIKDGLDANALTMILHNPVIHISGMMFLIQGFFTGQPICLLEKFNVPEWVDAVARYRPKYAGLPPTAIRMILDAGVPKEDLASLVAIRAGTAPLDDKTRTRFEETYGIPTLTNYGATEFATVVTQWRLEDYLKFGKEKPGSAGNPAPDVKLRVVDTDSFAELPVGSVGFLEVKASRFGPDAVWIRTTDLAELDADGFLYIRGRGDQAIIRGGFKIIPEVLSEVLARHPKVKDAAVLGMADERLGAVPVAAVEPVRAADPPSEPELIAYLREQVTSYQVPVRILVVDQLPRTPSMKVDLVALRALFGEAAEKA
jgi:long-chain acyl-CoA synthetase